MQYKCIILLEVNDACVIYCVIIVVLLHTVTVAVLTIKTGTAVLPPKLLRLYSLLVTDGAPTGNHSSSWKKISTPNKVRSFTKYLCHVTLWVVSQDLGF